MRIPVRTIAYARVAGGRTALIVAGAVVLAGSRQLGSRLARTTTAEGDGTTPAIATTLSAGVVDTREQIVEGSPLLRTLGRHVVDQAVLGGGWD
jgi:hypothetical protein